MSATESLEVTVVYSASKRRRSPVRAVRVGGKPGGAGVVILGLLNLAIAGGLYGGTWWYADPELRIIAIMHTPILGLSLDTTVEPPNPRDARDKGKTKPTNIPVKLGANAPTSTEIRKAAMLPGTIIGWEILATLATLAMASSGGSLLARGGMKSRTGGVGFGLIGLGLCAWVAWSHWSKLESITPSLIRYGVGAAVLLAGLLGMVLQRRARGLTRLAALLLILSAGGSAFGVYIAVQYNVWTPQDFPLTSALWPALALTFLAHSLWGWILIPLGSRTARSH